jgi:hypothetical protein
VSHISVSAGREVDASAARIQTSSPGVDNSVEQHPGSRDKRLSRGLIQAGYMVMLDFVQKYRHETAQKKMGMKKPRLA